MLGKHTIKLSGLEIVSFGCETYWWREQDATFQTFQTLFQRETQGKDVF